MKNRENWLSPMNKVLLIKAFRERAEQIKLRDGRVFTMRYDGEGDEARVFLKARDSTAPCGWFILKTVTDSYWITESPEGSGPKEGLYLNLLDEFIKSKVKGVDLIEEYPGLEGKLATTIQSGFAKAKAERGKRADDVRVLSQEGRVYLLREDDDD